MTEVMTGLVQYALQPQAVELRELPVPELGEEDVLLRVGAVSVCGSDVHQYHNKQSWAVNVPVVLGHEFGGTVARVGARVRGFKEGDRVVSETAASICGQCVYCRTGEYNLCPQRAGFGYGTHGAMAEFVRVPARCLHHIPDSLPFERAALTEPCCVGYNAVVVKSRVRPGDVVVVLGPGPIGLIAAEMARISGAGTLIVAGMSQDAPRLAAARALGVTHAVDLRGDGSRRAGADAGRWPGRRPRGRRHRHLDRAQARPSTSCGRAARSPRWAGGRSRSASRSIPSCRRRSRCRAPSATPSGTGSRW